MRKHPNNAAHIELYDELLRHYAHGEQVKY